MYYTSLKLGRISSENSIQKWQQKFLSVLVLNLNSVVFTYPMCMSLAPKFPSFSASLGKVDKVLYTRVDELIMFANLLISFLVNWPKGKSLDQEQPNIESRRDYVSICVHRLSAHKHKNYVFVRSLCHNISLHKNDLGEACRHYFIIWISLQSLSLLFG